MLTSLEKHASSPAGRSLPAGTRGYLFVITAAVLWATSGTAAKVLFRSGVSSLSLVQIRTTVSALILFCVLLVMKRELLRLRRQDLPRFAFVGLALAATHFTYLYAISRIQVSVAILLQYQAPVLIAAWAVFISRKRLNAATLIALVLAVAGCYFMVGAYRMDILRMNRAGIVGGLASAVSFALYSLGSETLMRRYSAWTVLAYALLAAAFIWNILQPPLAAFYGGFSAFQWVLAAHICVFGTVIAFGLYQTGIHRIGATRASITAVLEPVVAAVISLMFLREVFELWQIIGGMLVIGAIILLQLRRDERTEEP